MLLATFDVIYCNKHLFVAVPQESVSVLASNVFILAALYTERRLAVVSPNNNVVVVVFD